MKKMNNKGFSLVELIVVVLIMAIIAVALAPQVMKWVENSRKSTDCNNYDSVVSACNLALSNETVMKDVGAISGDSFSLTWAGGTPGASWVVTSAPTSFQNELKKILGDNWLNEIKVKRTSDGAAWSIKINKNGTVERTSAPSSDKVS